MRHRLRMLLGLTTGSGTPRGDTQTSTWNSSIYLSTYLASHLCVYIYIYIYLSNMGATLGTPHPHFERRLEFIALEHEMVQHVIRRLNLCVCLYPYACTYSIHRCLSSRSVINEWGRETNIGMCVCMYVSMYVCVYVCMCISIYMYICLYICIYLDRYMYMCIYVYMCIYIYIYIHILLRGSRPPLPRDIFSPGTESH